MTSDTILTIGVEAMKVTMLLSAPLLLTGLLVGVLIGMLQAATQIQEMTLSFIPKLIAMAFALALTGHWMLTVAVDYTHALFNSIPSLIG
ncbi:flagellar biosynthesis protein FliQ [Acidihalobacter ferrooxydans]|uniref:Flagellar biosynthetic protein FliQ n=1 Tax=Acidihalobacter ferrooxydans TaxID=1765967 RepID=A0A1P8UGT8_9GAMM|nr:flagellar biosynthesis protein FliQ [Acidihalobacter ferrooxydans]APZ43020.1 flagellar biosynthetic protein FliQ [Acidihalobacter ferrooxydans]